MREVFPSQPTLDTLPIAAVPLNTQGRDEIIPILAALQHLYADGAARDRILALIAADVNGTSRRDRGRPGLSYWQVLVLAAVRLGCNLDYDKLQNLAEEHRTLRRLMGIGTWADEGAERSQFDWRRIRDNLCRIRPETLEQINAAVVRSGHELEPAAATQVRGDSLVLETNIHHPTDASVLADGLRKVLQAATVVAALLGLPGWRQADHVQKRVRQLVRQIHQACQSKKAGASERRKRAYQPLLKLARQLLRRATQLVAASRGAPPAGAEALDWGMAQAEVAELERYVRLTQQVADTARRRVVLGETVPNADKIFSVFEAHTELINRGKTPVGIQFGRQVLVIEDTLGFIVHYELYERGLRDADVGVAGLRQAQAKVGGRIRAASFDRGFHTPANQAAFAAIVPEPCVPVRGAQQTARQQAEATEAFWEQRRRHPGVESLIQGLQAGNGLERCRDRTEAGMRRYLGLGVLGRNLHVLGKLVLARADAACQAAQSRRRAAG